MKVAIIKRGYYPGNTEPECHQYATILSSRGNKVEVHCLGKANRTIRKVKNGVEVVEYPDKWIMTKMFHLYLSFIVKGNFDVIHILWGKGSFVFPVIYKLVSSKRRRTFILCDVRSGAIFNGLHAHYVNMLIRFECKFFSASSCLDHNMEKRVFGKKSKKRHYIPEGVNLDFFNEIYDPNVAIIRKKYTNKYKKIMIYIGTLHEIRRLDIVLKAFYQIKSKLDFNLVFVGYGKGEEKLKSM